MQPPYIYWLHLLMTPGYCYVEMHYYVASVCESPHPVNTHRPSASRGAGILCITYTQVGVPVCLTYYPQVGVPYVSEVRESTAAAIDLATGNRNVD